MTKLYAQEKQVFDINKVTVVGSPTITSDGVASGFSSENYIIAQPIINPINSLEVLCSFITPTDVMTFQFIETLNGGALSCAITNGKFRLRYNGDIFFDVVANTEYFVKIKHENNNYTLLYTTNKKDWITVNTKEKSLASLKTLSIGGNSGVNPFLGSVDLTAFKIYVDNELIYSPTKPIYLLERRKPKVWNKGQFTIVGNPSISDDGIASGLSTNDYIVPTSLTLEQLKGKSWSYSFKCTIPDTSASSKYIISFANNLYPSLVGGIKFEGYGIYLGGKYGTTEDSTNELWKLIGTYSRPADVGKEVLITASFNIETGEYNAKAILDNKELNMTPYIPPTANKELYYINTNSSSKAFRVLFGNDKFYLKSIKIYTDNNLVFDGGAETYVYDPSKFTVVGSPTITEYGVASGFSKSDYIQIPQIFAQSSSWEIIIKITLSEALHGEDYFCNYGQQSLVLNMTNGILSWSLSSTGTNWDLFTGRLGKTKLQQYSTYFIKIQFTGEKYNLLLSHDNINWSLEDSFSSTAKIYNTEYSVMGINRLGDVGITGSIDLAQFSITVDGKEVFTGAKEKFYAMRGM